MFTRQGQRVPCKTNYRIIREMWYTQYMDYTPEEVAYIQSLFGAYKDMLAATVSIIGTSENPAVLALAVDTLQDMSEEISEVQAYFQAGGVSPVDAEEMDEAQTAAAPYIEMMAKVKATQKLRGVFLPVT